MCDTQNNRQIEIRAEVSDETAAKLEALAKDKGVSVKCLIAELIERELYG